MLARIGSVFFYCLLLGLNLLEKSAGGRYLRFFYTLFVVVQTPRMSGVLKTYFAEPKPNSLWRR
jgi:hypothetical protein